jgi:hypothetical protein
MCFQMVFKYVHMCLQRKGKHNTKPRSYLQFPICPAYNISALDRVENTDAHCSSSNIAVKTRLFCEYNPQ